ncbi:MAG: discoidin domain-containing protein, partial [Muribaculaceae bacterium]|nr:discoidin domain-containing protein [Muribaculaceae bacterium]
VKDGRSVGLAIFPDNRSDSWPSWEVLKSTVDSEPLRISEPAEITIVEQGPLRTTVKVSRGYGDSKLVQYIRLYEGELADRIDFDNVVDWASANTLLKAEFPLTVADEAATYDLGLGVIRRGNNTDIAYEVPAQQWADLTDASGNYGVTVLNNSKYGWDKPDDNTLRLTLLHTPGTKRNYRHQNMQDFGHHEFSYSLMGHEGALQREKASRDAAVINQPVKAFVTDRHKGAARNYWLAASDASNVDIKALKRAEDGDGYVVRVYETAGRPAETMLNFALPVKSAAVADGTEKVLSELTPAAGKLPVSLKANGVGTYRVWFAMPEEKNVEMASVSLPYNRAATSYNDFRSTADFADGYSYAAELVPETLRSAGIEFALNPGIHENVLLCGGDTLQLPAGKWNKLHLLVAAAGEEDLQGDFTVGNRTTALNVPSYTGFVGQWGHEGHTDPLFKPERVAFVGTHRHSAQADEPYEYTYMFHHTLDIPRGATTVVLPDDKNIAVFAATVSADEGYGFEAAAPLFNPLVAPAVKGKASEADNHKNLLTPEMIIGYSGYVNEKERPALLVDGNERTKWCDVAGVPATIDFDLGSETALTGWRMVNAGQENPGYITSACYLQGRNSLDEDWHTLDALTANRRNVINRKFNEPQSARYLRLMVTTPTQNPTSTDTRIYELEVF